MDTTIKTYKSQYKKCTKCNLEKSLMNFWLRKDTNDGYEYRCIECKTGKAPKPICSDGEKFCIKCNTSKPISYFRLRKSSKDGYDYSCKECQNNPKIIIKDGYRICTKCNIEKPISEFHGNKKRPYSICRDCVCTTERRIISPTKENYKYCGGCKRELPFDNFHKDKSKKYGLGSRCKSCTLTTVLIGESKRRKTDSNFKIKKLLRSRIRTALTRQHTRKPHSTIKLIGCSIELLKEHLQKTAIDNGYVDFDINNYNGHQYHIDHVIPCASFDLTIPENQMKCFHYTNLQILTAQENFSKNDSIQSPVQILQ